MSDAALPAASVTSVVCRVGPCSDVSLASDSPPLDASLLSLLAFLTVCTARVSGGAQHTSHGATRAFGA